MGRWFRVYDDLVNDPKVQLLSGDMVKSLLNLWCLASQNDGVLPSMQTMSFKLRMKPAQIAAIITELSEAGLIDREGETFHPHNWNGRQYKSDVSTERVKRLGNANGNVYLTFLVTATTPLTKRPQTGRIKTKETRASALSPDWPPNYRERFWERFPNKVGKPLVLKKLDRIARSSVKWSDLMAGLERYIRTKPSDRPWLNPTTFLNQERWADQPASVVQLRRVPDV